MKQGDRVKVIFWGTPRTGTVTRDQRSSIVFVQFDGSHREHWFHATSVTPV